MKPVITLENVTKYYKDFKALNEISFEVFEGEVFGFIGKNGAGKTTTINIILSLLKPNDGTVSIFGKEVDVTNIEYKKNIGYVPDVPVFPSFYTAYEYLKYVVEVFQVEKSKDEILELLQFVGLEKANKRIGQFSRGMKQRLAIAQALIHNPKILIMDEPTSALDPTGRKDVLDIIQSLKGKTTIFYSTHILEDAEKVCDRVGLIHEGNIMFVKGIDEIENDYIQSQVYVVFEDELDVPTLQLPDTLSYVKTHLNGHVFEFKSGTVNEVILTLIELGLKIKSFELMHPSLEDVFIEVTK